MNFDERVHVERESGCLKLRRTAIVHRGHDDEDAIGAAGASLQHLIGIVYEVLAQHRQSRCRTRLPEVLEAAPKRGPVGQHRQACGAAGRIGFCQRRRIEVLADQAFRRARLLDLGDEGIVAGRQALLDRVQKTARSGRGLGLPFDRGQRTVAFCGRDLLALIGRNLLEDVSHRSTPRSGGRAVLQPCRNRASGWRARKPPSGFWLSPRPPERPRH